MQMQTHLVQLGGKLLSADPGEVEMDGAVKRGVGQMGEGGSERGGEGAREGISVRRGKVLFFDVPHTCLSLSLSLCTRLPLSLVGHVARWASGLWHRATEVQGTGYRARQEGAHV
jgi:hypothetical protein